MKRYTHWPNGILVGFGLALVVLSSSSAAQMRSLTLGSGEVDQGRVLCSEGACRTEIQDALAAYKPDPAKFPVPRTAWDAKPDFNGVYYPSIVRVRPPVPLESVLLPAVKATIQNLNPEIDAPEIHCYPDVPPIGLGRPMPVQMFQTPGYLAIMVATMGTYRVVRIVDGPPQHDPSIRPSFQGDGVGHWEGDTLVVDVTNFNGKGWLTPSASPHSDALHIVERFTKPDSKALEYSYTVEDPKMLSAPWQGEAKRLGMLPYAAFDFDPCVGVLQTLEFNRKALESEGSKRR